MHTKQIIFQLAVNHSPSWSLNTTLQSIMNAKLSQERFSENGLSRQAHNPSVCRQIGTFCKAEDSTLPLPKSFLTNKFDRGCNFSGSFKTPSVLNLASRIASYYVINQLRTEVIYFTTSFDPGRPSTGKVKVIAQEKVTYVKHLKVLWDVIDIGIPFSQQDKNL